MALALLARRSRTPSSGSALERSVWTTQTTYGHITTVMAGRHASCRARGTRNQAALRPPALHAHPLPLLRPIESKTLAEGDWASRNRLPSTPDSRLSWTARSGVDSEGLIRIPSPSSDPARANCNDPRRIVCDTGVLGNSDHRYPMVLTIGSQCGDVGVRKMAPQRVSVEQIEPGKISDSDLVPVEVGGGADMTSEHNRTGAASVARHACPNSR